MVDNPCIAWIGDHVNFFCEFCHTGFFPRLFQWNHHCCATRSVATGLVGLAPSGKVFDSLGGLVFKSGLCISGFGQPSSVLHQIPALHERRYRSKGCQVLEAAHGRVHVR